MAELKGFTPPLSATGKSSLVPTPPWHYSGEVMTLGYRTDPDRRLVEATLTLKGVTETGGDVNAHPMHHTRLFPSLDFTKPPSVNELVTMRSYDVETGDLWVGEPDVRLFPSPVEEFDLLQPKE